MNTQLVDTLVQIIRSLSATEQALLEKKLFSDVNYPSTLELMHLAEKGLALDFLSDEPDIYTSEDGEPV
ncbi:MAG: hypothetical protein QNJ63_13375 [Calothrix sp. MO_192.B10]|nr:hypothetical protein [Calothrix sp. MO_192.B10]